MAKRTTPLKAIFWDNDGVLVDTEELYFDVTRAVLEQAGFTLTREHFIDVSLRQGRSAFEAARAALDDAAIERLRSARNARYAERLAAGIDPLDGVADVLSALHGRVGMAVVTSSNPEHFDIAHRRTGLLRYFDFVLTNQDYAHTKPHPAPYLAALARAGLAANECIAVEDSERGLVAARAAGLRCIVVPRGLTHGGAFTGAHCVLSDIREISAVLEPMLAS